MSLSESVMSKRQKKTCCYRSKEIFATESNFLDKEQNIDSKTSDKSVGKFSPRITPIPKNCAVSAVKN